MDINKLTRYSTHVVTVEGGDKLLANVKGEVMHSIAPDGNFVLWGDIEAAAEESLADSMWLIIGVCIAGAAGIGFALGLAHLFEWLLY